MPPETAPSVLLAQRARAKNAVMALTASQIRHASAQRQAARFLQPIGAANARSIPTQKLARRAADSSGRRSISDDVRGRAARAWRGHQEERTAVTDRHRRR